MECGLGPSHSGLDGSSDPPMVISPAPECAVGMTHLVKDEPSLWFPNLWDKRLHKGKVEWRPWKQPPLQPRQ